MKAKIWPFVFAAILLLSFSLILSPGLGAEDPWDFLDGFTPLPRTLTRVGEHYVAMLFVNREQQQMAAVIFNAACGQGSCELNHRAGFAVVNAEGSNTRLYVDPGEIELMELMGSIYVRYSKDIH